MTGFFAIVYICTLVSYLVKFSNISPFFKTQRSAAANGNGPRGPNLDVFNANVPTVIPAASPAVPALFPMPPPKYVDNFPHQEPGQVEDMLKEADESDSETDRSTSESPSANANNNGEVGNGSIANGGVTNRASSGQTLRSKDRSNVYMCNNNDE